MDAIREQVEAGKLTQEQAREQVEKLGFKGKGSKERDKNDLQMQLDEAVKANDEIKIKELLPRMLQQLLERNQQMTERLVGTNE